MTTARAVILDGFSVIQPNETVNADGFYISYNDYDVSIYGDATTALVLGQFQHFYILNGNHMQAYQELMPKGFYACLQYFTEHADQKNKMSEHAEKLTPERYSQIMNDPKNRV